MATGRRFKEGQYYWVRQKPTTDYSTGRSDWPAWEPMLYSDGKFWHKGLPNNSQGLTKNDLASVGARIDRPTTAD